MLARVLSSAVMGIDAYIVKVEIDISDGLPSFSTVGLPDSAVKESKDRVTAAIKNSGFYFPTSRITANLAPADVRKEGSAFDLPIAVGVMAATGQVLTENFDEMLMLGELALDGNIRPVPGCLPIAIAAKEQQLKGIMFPNRMPKRHQLLRDWMSTRSNPWVKRLNFSMANKRFRPSVTISRVHLTSSWSIRSILRT